MKHIIHEFKQQHKLKKDPKTALLALYTYLMNVISPYLKQLETMLFSYYTYTPHFLPVNTYLSSSCWPYGSHLFHHTPYLETSIFLLWNVWNQNQSTWKIGIKEVPLRFVITILKVDL